MPIITYCPVCDRRTVHNRARPANGIGIQSYCRDHTDVATRLDAGELEFVAGVR